MAILAGAAVLALIAGCTSSSPSPSATAYADGGTFTIAVAGDPGTLNALNNTATTANWLFKFLYEPLVTRGQDGSIQPGLATKFKFDGTVATFTINDKATCSDGTKITPSVIAKSFAYVKNPANPSTVIGAVLPDRNFTYVADDATSTFTLTLASPFSLLMSSLSFMPMVCGAAADNPKSLVSISSGTGPYTLKTATPNSEYVLSLRDGYTWGAKGAVEKAPKGTPTTVVYKIVDNETTAANLLASGAVNAAVVNGQDRTRLVAAGATEKAYTSGGVVMSFNEAATRITSDKNVRLALTMAIDRDAVAKTVTQGLLPKAGTSVSAANPQVCDDSAAAKSIPKKDIAAAKKLLDDAGWKAGADGVRVKDGKPLSLMTGYSTATPGAAAAAELIASYWKAIGVTAVITPLSQADYTLRVFSTGDYDVMPVEQFSNPFPSTLTGLFGGPFPPAGTNAGHVDNADYKAAIVSARASGDNSGCKFWTEASKALFTSADVIPMAAWPTNWVTKGAVMDTLGGRPLATSIRMLATK